MRLKDAAFYRAAKWGRVWLGNMIKNEVNELNGMRYKASRKVSLARALCFLWFLIEPLMSGGNR